VSYKAAVIQAASVPFDPVASAERAVRLIADAAGASARLAVFPEVFIGGYPKGASFGTTVGQRLPAGRTDLTQITRAKYDFDVVGHYARPDIFRLLVDETPKLAVDRRS